MVQNQDQERERRRGSFGFSLRGEEQIFFYSQHLRIFGYGLKKIHLFNPEPSYDIYSVSLEIVEREPLTETRPLSIVEILSIKNFLFDAFPIPYNI